MDEIYLVRQISFKEIDNLFCKTKYTIFHPRGQKVEEGNPVVFDHKKPNVPHNPLT